MSPTSLVFPSTVNTQMTNSKLNERFKKVLKLAGLPSNIRVYDNHHAFGTNLNNIGVDPRTIADLMGHESVRTTFENYIHSNSEQKTKAVTNLENVAFSKAK